jgi:hypothetical protein
VELVQTLNAKQITTLAQASNNLDPVTLAEVWKNSYELNLTDALAT